MNKRLEVDAQVIHLNPAQELFQENGDKDFRGIREAIARFVEVSPIPVIVKETGCAYVDVAGHGGTSWIMVEAARGTPEEWEEAQDFADWGWPTADILIHLRGESSLKNKILASGGLRSAMDLAKSLALGASLGGMALPFIQAVVKGGSEAVLQLIQKIEKNLRRIHLLTGCRSPQELSTLPLEIFPAR
jgi:isopentenyl-diphosphate delta-isomerase type 2